MRISKLFLSIFAGCSFTACSYLDFDESIGQTKDEVYSTFDNIRQLVAGVYSFLPQDFGVMGNALRESASDNAMYVWNTSNVYKIYEDKWSPSVLVDDVWGTMYTGIQAANSYLENYNEEYLERLSLNADYKEQIEKFRMYPFEVRALRAFYYFELIKRYGDVPLVTETLQLDDVNNLHKTSFSEIVDFLVRECDEIAPELPINQNDFFLETGRVTRGMVMALKSRILLYAASPLHNETGNREIWKAAAEAAYDLIETGWYSLPNIDSDPIYSVNGGNEILKSSQLIFERRNGDSNYFEQLNLPIGFEGGNSGNVPTQNLVDAYEMKSGEPFDWDNPDHVKHIYVDENGNQTRDPRFYKTIVYNGATLMNTVVETFDGGKNGLPLVGATTTGYYLRKYVNETVSLSPENPISKPHHYILFRYAEVLLNYAEAMHEWQEGNNPDYKDSDFPLSAREALNIVRTAANMPAINETGADFTKRLRNERRVELAFEDHRFWDIRRWKIGDTVEDIYGVQISKSGTYTKINVQNRIWDDKMYLYPISQQEVYKNSNLVQNEGW
ncbi:RagB/SusD family nutrient uptake outer membrane protein [uncultured Bacteroides sp.]|uniref:RagB/SusD family nutrient uptake outer membrane protein n=1 Tax=uncultured Bacteroides sp. TaxID=162156 RepID=UPI0026087ACF|nr:RagB/SusD family nutrient uptake outer membrane protein [uncultured Bacteroides sp.]